MRVIIAGTRDLTDFAAVEAAVDEARKEGFNITEVVSGGARGVDKLGEEWAERNGVPVRVFEAEWRRHRGAGLERNREMADYADGLIAIWDGKSKGTLHMIEEARRKRLRVYVHRVN